jgi:arylsulfatase A-like enzyme
MLSGVPPEVHGVEWNRYQPWRHVTVPTLFSVCRVERLRCGLFAGKRKFAHFAEDEAGAERYAFGASAREVLDLARAHVAERDPDFVMIHLAEVDLAGHDAGWGSPAQLAALREVDARLGEFLAALPAGRPLRVLVTADHGGHGTRHGSDQPEDVRIPWIAWGDGVAPERLAGPVSTLDTAPTVLAWLGVPAPAGFVGTAQPVAR